MSQTVVPCGCLVGDGLIDFCQLHGGERPYLMADFNSEQVLAEMQEVQRQIHNLEERMRSLRRKLYLQHNAKIAGKYGQ